jgi:hemoglobin-like flavoprotein
VYLTDNEIDLIETSFKEIKNQGNCFAKCFYSCLFDLSPMLEPMFKKDTTEQEKHFTALLVEAIENLSNPEVVIKKLEVLGQSHKKYGVKEEHFILVKGAFLVALEYELRSACTPEVKLAWSHYYDWLSKPMLDNLS